MNQRWRGTAAALLTALTMTVPALGAQVELDGVALPPDQGWIEDGTSYITLRAYAAATGRDLTWEDGAARLTGGGLTLEARPGALYITANDRPLYVAGGVRVVDGRLSLPLRVAAQATGGSLRWDGASATAGLDCRNARPEEARYDEEALYWLSRVISAESRGEPLLGQIAVGNVVLNRTRDKQFPDTVRGVVFDRNNGVQFEPVSNGTIYEKPTDSAVLAAKLCLEGASVVGDSLYFYAPALSAGTWIKSNRDYYSTIGCHRFYR